MQRVIINEQLKKLTSNIRDKKNEELLYQLDEVFAHPDINAK